MTTEQKYKAIKKRLGLTDTDVARMFGYTSLQSYASSSGKIKIVRGIVEFYELVGDKLKEFATLDDK